MIHAFFYGIMLAFGLIIPLGVQNIFVFNQGAAQKKFAHALPSAITAFLCDFILIVCATLGVSLIVLTIPALKTTLLTFGILFLLYMGTLTWKNRHQSREAHPPLSVKAQIIFSASVSLLNPHALLDTIGVIGTYSLQFSIKEKYAFSFGCILISLFWFILLSFAGRCVKQLDNSGAILIKLNQASAIVMWFIAATFIWSLCHQTS